MYYNLNRCNRQHYYGHSLDLTKKYTLVRARSPLEHSTDTSLAMGVNVSGLTPEGLHNRIRKSNELFTASESTTTRENLPQNSGISLAPESTGRLPQALFARSDVNSEDLNEPKTTNEETKNTAKFLTKNVLKTSPVSCENRPNAAMPIGSLQEDSHIINVQRSQPTPTRVHIEAAPKYALGCSDFPTVGATSCPPTVQHLQSSTMNSELSTEEFRSFHYNSVPREIGMHRNNSMTLSKANDAVIRKTRNSFLMNVSKTTVRPCMWNEEFVPLLTNGSLDVEYLNTDDCLWQQIPVFIMI
ncbi:uncharacterized protein DEA37_0000687 [Paragonimus westermani]|uniref:Uncharacterized protein n=1 Tax=Paragonimus westermani TaxID=34504 RepID=A0A5J4NWJ6_9TREM|nr:uncharacterized protein DEA37_0000687 [Paragonimus westermani]